MSPVPPETAAKNIMDKNQQDSRRSATREFISSLDALKEVLSSDADEAEHTSLNPADLGTPMQKPSPDLRPDSDLETLLDDALQDIERFMSEHPKE